MKKTILVACLLMSAGCNASSWLDTRSVHAVADRPAQPPLPSGPITVDIVEAANAHRVAEAVWDEMDRDQQRDLLPASKKEKGQTK